MTLVKLRRSFEAACWDISRHHTFQTAAALSYYLVLSIFPALILASTMISSIPFPELWQHGLDLLYRILPADTLVMLRPVFRDLLAAHRTPWFSFGMATTIWVGSTAFSALIDALDVAYDVRDGRPVWKTSLLAIGLFAITSGLALSALAVMVVGPRFGSWLATKMSVSREFLLLWPFAHWVVAFSFILLTVELLYFFAPNVKQRFLATLPGAFLAVACWIGLSYLLGFYFRHIANYSHTYGTLGGFIAFMTWVYWNALVLLVGAELNSELAKDSARGQLLSKSQTQEPVDLEQAA